MEGFLKENYGFKEIKELKKFKSDRNYSFETENKKFLLKILSKRFKEKKDTIKFIENVNSFKRKIIKGGFPVILPLKTKKGQDYVIHDNKINEIYDFIEESKEKKTKKEIVHFLEHMHKIASILKLEEHPRQFSKILMNLTKKAEENPIVKQTLIEIKDMQLDKIPIHGDIKPGNFIFKKHNLYMIDFESLMVAPKTYDLASFIVNTSIKENYLEYQETIYIIKHYNEKNMLSRQEIMSIFPLMIMYEYEQLLSAKKHGLKDYETKVKQQLDIIIKEKDNINKILNHFASLSST